MRFKIILLPLSFLFIVGTAEKCFKDVEYVLYEDGAMPRTLWISEEVCCSGYQNVSGTCEPLCIPSCVKGTCTHPNVCACIDDWYGDSCDLNVSGCSSVGNCECSPGYFGNKCLYSCPRNTYGSNCLQECQCENCRKTDGYCKCQMGWEGTECTDYCPVRFYDTSNNKCVNRIEIVSNKLLYCIIGMAIAAGIIILVAVIVYLKRRKPRYDSMVNINATTITLPLPNIPNSNDYETETDDGYETIPARPHEIPNRWEDPAYYKDYEVPNIERVPETQPSLSRHDTFKEERF